MPEQVINSQRSFTDVIVKIINNGRDSWSFTSWTTPGTAIHPTAIINSISTDKSERRLRHTRHGHTHPNGTTRNFTIRQDYDFALGLPSAGRGGEGYLVNVELRSEKKAYSSPTKGEANSVQMLSQRRLHNGDQQAAEWFMKEVL